jgi:hypothetical protein
MPKKDTARMATNNAPTKKVGPGRARQRAPVAGARGTIGVTQLSVAELQMEKDRKKYRRKVELGGKYRRKVELNRFFKRKKSGTNRDITRLRHLKRIVRDT